MVKEGKPVKKAEPGFDIGNMMGPIMALMMMVVFMGAFFPAAAANGVELWCPVCGAGPFSSQAELDLHMAAAHPGDLPVDIDPLIEAAEQWALEAEAAANACLTAIDIHDVAPQVQIAINAMNMAIGLANEAIAVVGTVDAAPVIAAMNRATTAANAALAELNRRWEEALEDVTTLMNTAYQAASNAMEVYNEAQTLFIDPVIVCEHQNYSGGAMSVRLWPPLMDLGYVSIGNDVISSVRVKPGFKVTLYENINLGGASIERLQDTPNLAIFHMGWRYDWFYGYRPVSWNDQASSIAVDDSMARAKLNSVRIETVAAVSAARDAAIYARSMADDVLILGILIALATNLLSIANELVYAIDWMLAQLS